MNIGLPGAIGEHTFLVCSLVNTAQWHCEMLAAAGCCILGGGWVGLGVVRGCGDATNLSSGEGVGLSCYKGIGNTACNSAQMRAMVCKRGGRQFCRQFWGSAILSAIFRQFWVGNSSAILLHKVVFEELPISNSLLRIADPQNCRPLELPTELPTLPFAHHCAHLRGIARRIVTIPTLAVHLGRPQLGIPVGCARPVGQLSCACQFASWAPQLGTPVGHPVGRPSWAPQLGRPSRTPRPNLVRRPSLAPQLGALIGHPTCARQLVTAVGTLVGRPSWAPGSLQVIGESGFL